jgi:phage head maturation protease
MALAAKARGASRSGDGLPGEDEIERKKTPGISRGEYYRTWELEDIHIVRTAQGDSTGRLVEAYAAAFGQVAEIHDHQGHYKEENDPAAFNAELETARRSRAGLTRIKCMYNHAMTIHGTPSSQDSVPLGVPEYIGPEARGLITRTLYMKTPRAEEILEAIKAGAITAQSYTGRIIRSSPELRGQGDRHRARNGVLTLVRRLQLGLREYGPTPFPAFSGAEILGVRMQLPGDADPGEAPEDFAPPLDEESGPDDEAAVTGSVPEDTTSVRYHQHALYALRSKEAREKRGLTW